MPPGRLIKVDVHDAEAGQRLDRLLAARLPDTSRARLQELIRSGHVLLDERTARPAERPAAGQTISIRFPPPVPATPPPEDLPLHVVYEDRDLIVVDKPAGLVVHPGAGITGGTLVNALLHHVADLSGVGGVLRPGIVHRLDKGTSGLLVVAKNDVAHRGLARQFAARTVHKEYLAVVHGVPDPATGSICAPIGRHHVHRTRMHAGAPRGRPARSDYAVEQALDGAALLRVRILTGRTHQIRVHLASLGHPVVGDKTYGGGRTPACRSSEAREALRACDRPALHAARLGLAHPADDRPLVFESPLPPDLAALLETLRSS